jgi:hypothetical protein
MPIFQRCEPSTLPLLDAPEVEDVQDRLRCAAPEAEAGWPAVHRLDVREQWLHRVGVGAIFEAVSGLDSRLAVRWVEVIVATRGPDAVVEDCLTESLVDALD